MVKTCPNLLQIEDNLKTNEKSILAKKLLLIFIKILKNVANKNYFNIDSVNSFSNDYAQTLNIWNQRFSNNWKKIEKLGFDENFKSLIKTFSNMLVS